jgi:tetrahydromethanopterin S-methyltransferase subunit G
MNPSGLLDYIGDRKRKLTEIQKQWEHLNKEVSQFQSKLGDYARYSIDEYAGFRAHERMEVIREQLEYIKDEFLSR